MSRQMKDSGIAWIGAIPEGWKVMRHKDVMYKIKDIQDTYQGQDIISLTIGGVIVRDLDAGGKMPTTFDGYQLVHSGNLLMCLFDIDVTPRCVGLIKNDGVTSPAYSQFSLKQGYAPYYDYLLRYMDDEKCLLHLSKNLRSSLTETDFGAISTILPPVTEQKLIVNFLDTKCSEIDDLIAIQEQFIEELKAYKQSVITETVTKGLNPNVEMKDSGIEWIGKIPATWSVDRLKSLGYLYGGLSGKAGDDFNVNEETDKFALFIPFTNICNNIIIQLDKLYKVKIQDNEEQNEVKQGDILFLMSSEDFEGLGKSALMADEIPQLYLNSFCKGLRIRRNGICSSYIN